MPTAKPAPVFFLMTGSAPPLVRVKSSSASTRTFQPGNFIEAGGNRGTGQMGDHAVAMLARIRALICVGGGLELLGNEAAEADGIELRPRPMTCDLAELSRSAAT